MAKNNKTEIILDNGNKAEAQAPVIVSASRSTDIPAFYADWFFERLEKGYSAWTNPFNGVKSYISYQNTRFIVFWSKNPKPLLSYLDILQKKNIHCYIQYTLNDYDKEKLEKGVPPFQERIETFKALSERLGRKAVIWRFDPLLLTKDISVDCLIDKIEYIGNQLQDYTERLVFSFADILSYRKVKSNLEKNNVAYIDWTDDSMHDFSRKLAMLNKKWKFHIATCAEKIDLTQYGIMHSHCVDDELIAKLAYNDNYLMEFLNLKVQTKQSSLLFLPNENEISLNEKFVAIRGKSNKDKGQRTDCGCIVSKDIGEYNTCPHLCEYCYANSSKEIALKNYHSHRQNPYGETITGK